MVSAFWPLLLSVALFTVGTWGVVLRRHALVTAMSAQVMALGAILLLGTGAQIHGVDGRVLALLGMGLSAVQAVVALCLVARRPPQAADADVGASRRGA